MTMNVRKALYFGYHRFTGSSFPSLYEDLVRQDRSGVAGETTQHLLTRLLSHCRRSVPYYAQIMQEIGGGFEEDPQAYLLHLPILTKAGLREHFESLVTTDLAQRHWYFNTSGGSTGEPVRLIQDRAYRDHEDATQQFYSLWAGADVGDREVHVWGSERDILGGDLRTKIRLLAANKLLRRTVLNAFRMSTQEMRQFIDILNTRRPQLIVAYVDAIYELARFAQRERLGIRPQSTIITTAGTLYPFMRQTIEKVFHCQIFNRYGSRELGDIAGECSAHRGLHVFSWSSYVEIVDEAGKRLPAGSEGNIVVTCLNNFAMPLIRYQIGDRGTLAPEAQGCPCGRKGQILEGIIGRNDDVFKTKDGTLIEGGFFGMLLYSRPWIRKCQVIQKSYTSILFRIKPSEHRCEPEELTEITNKTRVLMGKDCQVEFEFVDDIATTPSGKYRYILSEVNA